MDLEIVTVGTELLLGFTIDTNAAEIARALSAVGARIARRATVPDDENAIRDAVAGALRRSRFVVLTGGLGPTRDDVTKRAVARLFGVPLELDEAALRELEERFQRYGRGPLPPSNRSQAEIPRGATVLRNPRGTAPGLLLDGPLGTAVLLPGVPSEMRAMLEEQVVPLVEDRVRAAHGSGMVIRSRTLRTVGVTESSLASALAPVEPGLGPVSIAYLPGPEGVDLRLTAWRLAERDAEAELARAVGLLRPVLGADCYGEDDTDLAAVVLQVLRDRGCRLAVAESCTGGHLGARLTAIPGASEVFVGGTIAYADETKVADLGVSPSLLHAHGAVSEPVVREMARGAARRFAVEAALAVTGIAGPTGGTPEKPVGTVWLAASVEDRDHVVVRRFPGGREEVRRRAVQAALDLLRRLAAGL